MLKVLRDRRWANRFNLHVQNGNQISILTIVTITANKQNDLHAILKKLEQIVII